VANGAAGWASVFAANVARITLAFIFIGFITTNMFIHRASKKMSSVTGYASVKGFYVKF
jgi:hypothetical protein